MQIHGLNKTTLLDYPQHVAATIFTGGCNFCCPFCHNGELVLKPQEYPQIPEDEIMAFLKKEREYSPVFVLPAESQHFKRIFLHS